MKQTILKIRNKVSKTLFLTGLSFLLFSTESIAQTITPWLTKGDQTKLLSQEPNISFGTNSGTSATTITINPNTTYQSIDGFGYTLTQGSAEVISSMNATQQTNLLNELFNTTTGLGVSALRVSIAASDLSSSNYSYNEVSGDVNMTNFSLNGPDLTYLIPILKKILLINPNIKILATPWSPPRWMKDNNSWVGGRLKTNSYAAYANYFIKYFQAMQGQGINIWAITPQNEPENPFNNPSMLMNSTEQTNFINNNLGPAMANAGFGNIKIIAFDHNCDNTAYPIDVCNNSTYVDGAAFHLYAGDISAMSTVKNATNKNVYFTEQFTSTTGDFSGDLAWHMQNIVTGSLNNWSKTVFEWNLANNASFGPFTDGGCTTCLGAITINNSTSYSRNVAYYIIGQVSKFVKPNALRINSSSSNASIYTSAFKNQNGSIAVLAYNSSTTSQNIKLVNGNNAINYTVPSASAVTFVWQAGQTQNVPVTGVSVSPTSSSIFAGQTTQLIATVAPSNASNTAVNWSSSNTAIASVNTSGLVTANAIGSATITATSVNGNKTATATITVKNQQAYNNQIATIPGIIQAENYDLGGQNIAYFDTNPTNEGGAYRTNEGVDISSISGTNGFTVGWTANGEWLEYTTNVTAGTYSIIAKVATPNAGKQLRVKLDNTTLATLTIPNTGSWDTFKNVTVNNIVFSGGNNKMLRLEIIGGDFNIDSIEIKASTTIPVSGVTVNPTSATINLGSTSSLTATVSPANATNKGVTWTSSNTAVASVSNTGIVTGTATGTATITVKTVDGNKIATATVTVIANNQTGFIGYYNIISRNSNKGLDVANNATNSGARIQQYDITNGGGDNQRWKFEDAGNGNYYIKVKSTQMCLVPENSSTNNGVKIVQKPQVNSNLYKWTITSLGGGFYKIINVNSGKSLDVEGVSTANGASIQVWDYSNNLNQQWQFIQVESITTKEIINDNSSIENENITVFLNPNNNTLIISSKINQNGKIVLCSITGERIIEAEIRLDTTNKEVIDISSFEQGIYIVKIENEGNILLKKIIKK